MRMRTTGKRVESVVYELDNSDLRQACTELVERALNLKTKLFTTGKQSVEFEIYRSEDDQSCARVTVRYTYDLESPERPDRVPATPQPDEIIEIDEEGKVHAANPPRGPIRER